MIDITSDNYIKVMSRWLRVLPEFLRISSFNKNLLYYGTGESAHWAIQSNCNIFAALAILATSSGLDESKRRECKEFAVSILRYVLTTHLTGNNLTSDGNRWGHSWISVLGLERMTHGLNAIRDELTEEDNDNIKKVMISESDWLLDNHRIKAGMMGRLNSPEANIWNGGFMLRTALEYPDSARHDEYLEGFTRRILNGISHPLDAASEVRFSGKAVREWHLGFNFTPNYGLSHHDYLNIGYMIIPLSNIAMLHFNFKERGHTIPPELYWHVKDLWQVVKNFIFPDGRLMRIGGDTRARYTYCQCYAIPVWLLVADLLGDTDAVEFERRWLDQVKKEMDYSADGGFYSRRLATLREMSYFYYTRLESDAILSLSYGAYWRRKFKISSRGTADVNSSVAWKDEYHGANLLRQGGTIRSWVWSGAQVGTPASWLGSGAQGATGLCVPADRSDMAEWQSNLHGELLSPQTSHPEYDYSEQQPFDGGFLNFGCCNWREIDPFGEGEGNYLYARQQTAIAALPDGCTMLILDYAKIEKEVALSQIKGLNLKVPNDLFNDSIRHYYGDNYDEKLVGNPGRNDTRMTRSNWLTIDNAITVFNIYGSDELIIHRPATPNIVFKKPHGKLMHSLYADEICSQVALKVRRYMPGCVVLDCGYAVSVGTTLHNTKKLDDSGDVRGVEFTTSCGKTYALLANFSENSELPKQQGKIIAIVEGRSILVERD